MTWDTPADPPPDDERRRLASCQGKSIFLSWSQAHRRAKKMNRRAHERGDRERFEPYRCDDGHIHIGSRDLNTKRKARTRRGRHKRKDNR